MGGEKRTRVTQRSSCLGTTINMINIRMLKTVIRYGVKYSQGAGLKAVLNSDGTATHWAHPYPVFEPDEFELVIPEEAFTKLLVG